MTRQTIIDKWDLLDDDDRDAWVVKDVLHDYCGLGNQSTTIVGSFDVLEGLLRDHHAKLSWDCEEQQWTVSLRKYAKGGELVTVIREELPDAVCLAALILVAERAEAVGQA